MEECDYPALYKSADAASLRAQRHYFVVLGIYLVLLILAASVTYLFPSNKWGAVVSLSFFLITLSILVWLKLRRPEDTWYNGRAVAESVKTRAWRWMMRADPYDKCETLDDSRKEFLADLKEILSQNKSLSHSLEWTPDLGEAISQKMVDIRGQSWEQRLKIYVEDRIEDQATWYSKKSVANKQYASVCFIFSVALHLTAISILIYKITDPNAALPIEAIATAASAVVTWMQSKKYNELRSSYHLAAHEISLIKSESHSVQGDENLSEFVINSETAFSREHTQWVARKNE